MTERERKYIDGKLICKCSEPKFESTPQLISASLTGRRLMLLRRFVAYCIYCGGGRNEKDGPIVDGPYILIREGEYGEWIEFPATKSTTYEITSSS